jgi:hypothetical protein
MTPQLVEVHDLRLTLQAAPEIWNGRVGENGSIEIHFRWGYLTVWVSHSSADPRSGVMIYEAMIDEDENAPGRAGDSCIGEARMKEALRDVCVFAGETQRSDDEPMPYTSV